MEQLLKSIKLLLAIILLVSLHCCKSSKNYKEIIFKETIEKSGHILYDWKNSKAYLLDEDIENINLLSKAEIKNLIKEVKFIFILRKSILNYKKSPYLSLHLCKKTEKIIVSKKDLLFNNYYLKKVQNITLYKVEGFKDGKIKLVFCW